MLLAAFWVVPFTLNPTLYTLNSADQLPGASSCRVEGNNFGGFKDVCLKNGASQVHNLATAVLFVSKSRDSGPPTLNPAPWTVKVDYRERAIATGKVPRV